MDYQNFVEFAPIVLIIVGFLIQHRLVVTPEQLERTHREILSEVELRYAKQDSVCDLKDQISDINVKITKIYELVVQALHHE
ncbi:hypothetical protein IJE86_06040 [bacterium]|nr:hypothetical protein [bacterium]